jgi:hypothetical protein
VLALIHPELFDVQFRVMEQLASGDVEVSGMEHMKALFEHWSTPFNGVTVIANHETALHRDMKGGRALLDLVSAFGNYTSGRFEVPLLGARFFYNPGTLIALPGYVFEHGASKTNGERICLVSFIRPNVGEAALGVYAEPSLPTLKDLHFYHELDLAEVPHGDIWSSSWV